MEERTSLSLRSAKEAPTTHRTCSLTLCVCIHSSSSSNSSSSVYLTHGEYRIFFFLYLLSHRRLLEEGKDWNLLAVSFKERPSIAGSHSNPIHTRTYVGERKSAGISKTKQNTRWQIEWSPLDRICNHLHFPLHTKRRWHKAHRLSRVM